MIKLRKKPGQTKKLRMNENLSEFGEESISNDEAVPDDSVLNHEYEFDDKLLTEEKQVEVTKSADYNFQET